MMRAYDGKISGVHFMFAIASIMQGSVLLTSFVLGVTKQDTWLVVIAGYIASLMISYIYISLVRRFPGKTLVEMLLTVFGNVVGTILSILYFYYFLTLAILNSNSASNFVNGRMMPETPKVIVLAAFLFVAVWAVRSGAVNLLRFGVIFCVLAVIVLSIDVIFTVQEFKFEVFLPILIQSPMKYVQGTHILTTIPFCESVFFMMIFPYLRNQGEIKKVLWGGLSIGAATMFIVVVRETAVLGNMAWTYTLPTYESIRLINIGDILTRMEVLFAFTILILLIFKVMIIFYAASMTVSQVCRLKSFRFLAPVLGAIIAVTPLFLYDSASENMEFGSNIAPVYSLFFQFVLPFLTLIVAMIRFPKKNMNSQVQPQQQEQNAATLAG